MSGEVQLVMLAGAGGALGAGLRHLVNVVTVKTFGLGVPWATLSVNVAGSFIMGCLAAYLLGRMPEAVGLRIFLGTGILGGFTTFSAFSLDAVQLFEQGATWPLAAYILASVGLSVLGCLGGLLAMRAVLA